MNLNPGTPSLLMPSIAQASLKDGAQGLLISLMGAEKIVIPNPLGKYVLNL
jgi:hypothetical protein